MSADGHPDTAEAVFYRAVAAADAAHAAYGAALRAVYEAARAEGEAAGRAAELRLREVGQILIAEIGAAGPTFTEDVARAAVARIQAAEAEAERLRSAIAETLRLAGIYAGVAAHNAEAEPETAGEAWRSAGAATVRELRRALGGAA